MRHRGIAALVFILALPLAAMAVTPQFWENFTQADLLEGDLDHMAIASDGKLFLSPAYDMIFDTEQPYIFSMVRDKKGNLYVGTGDDGKVFRIDPEGKGTLFFKADEINVFAMALDSSDTLYVGTSPDGKVYKVTAPNQATEYFDPEDKYIWSMLFDAANNLYVGTGGGGNIYKVDAGGASTVFYQCADTHVTCLARNQAGDLLAGTSPSGLLLEITSEGKGFTLADTPMEEVRALAFDPYGGIYAVAASSAGVSAKSASSPGTGAGESKPAPAATVLLRSVTSGQKSGNGNATVQVPENGKPADGTKSAVYLISKEGSMETIYSSRTQMALDAAVTGDGSLLLATGPEGRLFSINASKQVTVLSDIPEEHITRLLVGGDVVYAAGSNQGKVYAFRSVRASAGAFESKILDAQTVASWGKIFWKIVNPGEAHFELFTRTGNTDKIDNSWSDWSEAYTDSGRQIVSPDARYLQWRVSVKQGSASASTKEPVSDLLDGVRIAYLQKNLRPQVTKIEVLPYGIEFQRQPSLAAGGASVVVQATTPDGRALNAPRERGRNQPTPAPRQVLRPGAQSFDWEAADANQDDLEYSIYFKGESETDWKLLVKEYDDTFYTTYAEDLPDGVYRIKVVASDAPSNPSSISMAGELISQPFVISNTPPQVEITGCDVEAKKVDVKFRSCVAAGSIATSEISVDGEGWQLVFPVDGIADSSCEEYRFVTPDLTVGEHLIGVRSSDRGGNTGISKEVVRIP